MDQNWTVSKSYNERLKDGHRTSENRGPIGEQESVDCQQLEQHHTADDSGEIDPFFVMLGSHGPNLYNHFYLSHPSDLKKGTVKQTPF